MEANTAILNIRNLPLSASKLIYLVNQIDNYKIEQIDLIRNDVKMKKEENILNFDYGFNMYKFKIPDEVKEKYKNIQLVCYYLYYI